SASVSYTVSATDNHDPNPKVSCTYPKTGYTFPFGTTTVICTATDWVANSTTASFTIVVHDTTPPDTPQLYGPSNPSGASAYFYYYTNEVNVTWECSLDGAAFAGCGASYGSYSGLADGNHTFQVRAVDGSGNVG